MAKSIYQLEMGESAFVGPTEFTRVPGGWIASMTVGLCFVPYNTEYLTDETRQK